MKNCKLSISLLAFFVLILNATIIYAKSNDAIVSNAGLIKDITIWHTALNTKTPVSYKILQKLLEDHPTWPMKASIQKLIEQKMPSYLHASDIVYWFKKYPPLTGEGLKLYLDALIRLHRYEESKKYLKKTWGNIKLTEEETLYFANRYKSSLTKQDNIKRANNLFWAGRLEENTFMYNLLPTDYKKLNIARVKLARLEKGVDSAINNIPPYLKNDLGLIYARVYWRRSKNMDSSAAELLLNIKLKGANLPAAKRWWRERHILARRFIEKGNFKMAYRLVSNHKQRGGFSLAQAEFLSGFLALRFLDRPMEAFEHFYALYNNVKSPISLARAAYWLGRSADALKQKDVGRKWYLAAAQYPTTFYGQHAVEKLKNIDIRPLLKDSNVNIDQIQVQNFLNNNNMRILHILHMTGMEKYAKPFFTQALLQADDVNKYMAIMMLGSKTGNYHYNVFATKRLFSKHKILLFEKAYPSIPIAWRPISNKPDDSLIHAIVRQESNFDTEAVSPAGAMGLMQLMPSTATEVRKQLNIKRPANGKQALIQSPAYNIKLGSYYLKQLLDRFNGSAILAIAAYNAGPARVSRWVKERGDPRKLNTEKKIDWIELIPIYETRNYVQRVLENQFVYEYRLKPETEYIKLSSLF